MAAGDVKITYVADAAVTITLASLATSSTLVAGRESTAIDNRTNLYLDYKISGKITTGTSPTAAKRIEIWCIPTIEDTPTWPDVFDGTDSDETATSRDILASCGILLKVIPTDNTSDRTYPFTIPSLSDMCGGVCPDKFVLFVTHDTGQNLNATGGNHVITIQGIYQNVAQ